MLPGNRLLRTFTPTGRGATGPHITFCFMKKWKCMKGGPCIYLKKRRNAPRSGPSGPSGPSWAMATTAPFLAADFQKIPKIPALSVPARLHRAPCASLKQKETRFNSAQGMSKTPETPWSRPPGGQLRRNPRAMGQSVGGVGDEPVEPAHLLADWHRGALLQSQRVHIRPTPCFQPE